MSTFYQDGSWTVVSQVEGLAFDASGNLYIASNNTDTIEEVTPQGVASVFASNGNPGNPTNPEGLYNPIGLTFDSSGDLFVANFHHTQVPGEPYEGHGISYLDEYSSTGVLIDIFTGNLSLPGADPNLRDENYIAIRPGSGSSSNSEGTALSTSESSMSASFENLSTAGSVASAPIGTGVTPEDSGATVSPNTVAVRWILARDSNGTDPFFLALLRGRDVTPANNIALEATVGGSSHIVARKGEEVSIDGATKTVSMLTTLVDGAGTPADGRWRVDDTDFGMRATFSDNSQAIYIVPAAATSPASWSLVAETGTVDDIAALDGAVAGSFGLPGFSYSTEAYLADLAVGPAAISAADDLALVTGTTLLAQKGSEAPDATGAPMPGVLFKSLSDPVSGANGGVAFDATLNGAGIRDGTTGIWFAADGITPKLIGETGGTAPGGGHFAKFISMVLPAYTSGSDGPIFTATLGLGAGDHVTGQNDFGLWTVDGAGVLELLIRTGETVTVNSQSETVKTFSALQPAAGSHGVAAGHDDAGNITVHARFTDGTQAVLNLSAP